MLKPPESPPPWYCDFSVPETLRTPFQPLVYLSGLNINTTPAHRTFWECLNLKTGAKDFQPIYVTGPIDHKFRDKKIKSEFHEGSMTVPRGILKSNWINKHKEEIPSAVIVFFDMNWNDPQWQERKAELAKRIKYLKSSLSPHGTQVLVMLIKSPGPTTTGPGPGGAIGIDDNFTTERASALCAAAEIPPKYLFVLPYANSERITACIQRLEMGIRELSKAYYMSRIKKIKSWRDRATHTPLLVRYNFKIGFFQEVRKDYVAAHNHYQSAYDALFNIKATDATVQEIKVVASIINYRLCRLHLSKPDGKDVVSQFDKHIKSFLKVEGNPELLFEHYAWLSQEYYQFGELLQQFNKSGIPDPVTYFITAGKYIDKRRNDFYGRVKSKKPDIHWPPEMNPYITGEAKLVCYGQRPWWNNPFSHDYLFASEDPHSVQALQYFESLVKHSDLIISRWGIGSEYCRTKQRVRCRCQLMSMMGSEFLKSKEYSKCTMLMTHVLREFGQENWNRILYDVANIGIKGACSNGDIPAYCNFLVILLKLDLQFLVTDEKQSDLWEKLLGVIQGKIPDPEPGCIVDSSAWEANFKNQWISYVEIHSNSILDVNSYFPNESAQVSDEPIVKFNITNPSKFIIPIQKIGAKFNHSNYNLESQPPKILLSPGETITMELKLKLIPRDVTKILQLQVVYVDIGNEINSVLLHYSVQRKLAPYVWSNYPNPVITGAPGEQTSTEVNSMFLRLDPSKPLLSITTELPKNPIVVNDFTPIIIKLKNEDTTNDYTKIGLHAQLLSANGTKCLILEPTPDGTSTSQTYSTEIGKISASEEYSLKLWIKLTCYPIPDLKLIIKGKYLDSLLQSMTIEKTENLHAIEPFQLSTVFTDLQNNTQENLGIKQEFISQITLQNTSMAKLKLENIELVPNSLHFTLNHSINSSIPIELEAKETFTASFLMSPNNDSSIGTLSPGNLKLDWKNLEIQTTSTNTIVIPIIPIEIVSNSNSLFLTAHYSNNGHGKLKEPMTLDYTLVNQAQNVFDLHVSMEPSEAYMNAGPKRISLKLYGRENYTFTYVIFPLVTGMVDAPKLSFSTQPNGTTILDPIPVPVYQNAPKTIYITSSSSPSSISVTQ